jgi:hypothetical protein
MIKRITGIGTAIILMLTGLPTQAEIISAESMKDVQSKIDEVLKTQNTEDIIVAFDIDMTLTQPDHPAVYYPAIKKYVDVYKAVLDKLTPEQKDLASTLTTQIIPQKWVEKETPQIIKALQKQGIKMMALTSTLSGKIKGFPDKMVILRRDQLQKMGLDFTSSFKKLTLVATYFQFKRYAGSYPIFYHGILSTNGEGDASKGDVLVSFLTHIGPMYESKLGVHGYRPNVIIFVDDKRKHLESVEAALEAYDPSIQFIGIEYQGAYSYAPKDISKEDFQKFWENLAKKAKSAI